MTFPHSATAAQGDSYLVDLGRLVQVVAVSPMDAYLIANTSVTGFMEEGEEGVTQCPAEHPLVYQIDQAGELIAVFD